MCKVICKYTKMGDLKFISHLDVLRLMQRAVNRAKLPAKYSEGFNPHMKTSFGYPLSLGVESLGEYFELELKEKVDIDKIVTDLNSVMPSKIKILGAKYYDGKESLMSMSKYAEYLINIESQDINVDELNMFLDKMVQEGVIYTKEKKAKNKKNVVKKREINTKGMIHFAKVSDSSNPLKLTLEVVFNTTGDGSMKASDFIKVLENNNFNIDYYTALKVESLDIDLKPIII